MAFGLDMGPDSVVNIKVIGVEELSGWNLELDTGMGDVEFNGNAEGLHYKQSGSSGTLVAKTGMGNIILNCDK